MQRFLLTFLVVVISCLTAACQTQPAPNSQSGPAARIGEQIDRGLSQIGSELSQAWADVRKSVEKMSVQGRVYGRLHWDKALEDANLEVSVREGQVVVLSGTVSSAAEKQKAEELARDTIGVTTVVNELAVTAAN